MRILNLALLIVLTSPLSRNVEAQVVKEVAGEWFQVRPTTGIYPIPRVVRLSDQYDADDMAELAPVLRRIRDETSEETIWNIGAFGGDASCGKSAQTVINTVKDDLLPLGWDLDQMNSVDPLNLIFDSGTIHTVPMFTSSKGNSYVIDRYSGQIEIIKMDHIEGSNQVQASSGESSLLGGYYFTLGNGNITFAPDNTDVHFKGEKRCPVPEEGDEEETSVVTSTDPNDKLGSGGAGDSRYLSNLIPLSYRIRFENVDTASAPAQEVLVVDDLDMDVYDIETLTLGEVGFGDRRVAASGLSTYSTTIDLRPDIDILLRVVAALEPNTGRLVWRFSSVDPDTGELPADPFEGFLPPNQQPPEGEGYVTFTIQPKAHLPTGTVISNEARIFFDLNEPIDTPPWVNVVDRSNPESRVVSLSEVRPDTTFVVTWQGSDEGAGVKNYSLFFSENGGPFLPWLLNTNETSAVFSPDPAAPTQYSFYSIASDRAGNVESPKTEGEETTTVVVSIEEDLTSGLPDTYELRQNYPNPFNPTTTIAFDLPEPTKVRLRVFDILGREVALLLDDVKSAGRYRLKWDASGLASGSYFYRIETPSFSTTRTLTLLK